MAVRWGDSERRFAKATEGYLPPLWLQRDFARRVTAVEKLKATQRKSLAELDALFASLQHRAFNGEAVNKKEEALLQLSFG